MTGKPMAKSSEAIAKKANTSAAITTSGAQLLSQRVTGPWIREGLHGAYGSMTCDVNIGEWACSKLFRLG